jgi:hypothetical protein
MIDVMSPAFEPYACTASTALVAFAPGAILQVRREA